MKIILPEYDTKESEKGIVITILNGHFAGCEFRFGVVSIEEPSTPDGNAILRYNYDVINDATNKGDIETSMDFFHTVGKILEDVISGMDSAEGNLASIEYDDDIDSELQKVV